MYGIWPITFIVALIFRIPLSDRKMIEGVKTKKLNKAFAEVDRQMGCRHAIGYCICLTIFTVMTLLVLFFNYVYPHDYTMSWLMILCLIYFLDLLLFTFGFAAF